MRNRETTIRGLKLTLEAARIIRKPDKSLFMELIMTPHVNEIANCWPQQFKQVVSYLYHSEPLVNTAKFIEAISSDLNVQLEAVEDAQLCVSLLPDGEFDSVHDWSLAEA